MPLGPPGILKQRVTSHAPEESLQLPSKNLPTTLPDGAPLGLGEMGGLLHEKGPQLVTAVPSPEEHAFDLMGCVGRFDAPPGARNVPGPVVEGLEEHVVLETIAEPQGRAGHEKGQWLSDLRFFHSGEASGGIACVPGILRLPCGRSDAHKAAEESAFQMPYSIVAIPSEGHEKAKKSCPLRPERCFGIVERSRPFSKSGSHQKSRPRKPGSGFFIEDSLKPQAISRKRVSGSSR